MGFAISILCNVATTFYTKRRYKLIYDSRKHHRIKSWGKISLKISKNIDPIKRDWFQVSDLTHTSIIQIYGAYQKYIKQLHICVLPFVFNVDFDSLCHQSYFCLNAIKYYFNLQLCCMGLCLKILGVINVPLWIGQSGFPYDRFNTQPIPLPFGPYNPAGNQNKALHS